jgi:hypothetical protein
LGEFAGATSGFRPAPKHGVTFARLLRLPCGMSFVPQGRDLPAEQTSGARFAWSAHARSGYLSLSGPSLPWHRIPPAARAPAGQRPATPTAGRDLSTRAPADKQRADFGLFDSSSIRDG